MVVLVYISESAKRLGVSLACSTHNCWPGKEEREEEEGIMLFLRQVSSTLRINVLNIVSKDT